MNKKILVPAGILLLMISCNLPPKENFNYQQNFNYNIENKEQITRLVFEDVREETRLSNWNKSNWEIIDNGVRVTGCRKEEILRREKLIQDIYQGDESFSYIREYRVPWFTLSMGNINWFDYTVSTKIVFEKRCNAGIAFRYLNSREYYAFILDSENNEVRLVLRRMYKEATKDKFAWDELYKTSYDLVPGKIYNIQVEVYGREIKCLINNTVTIELEDSFRKKGKIALIADDQVIFGNVKVNGEMFILKETEPPKSAEPKLIYSLPLPGEDIERDFYFLDSDSDGENEIIIAENDGNKYQYRCLEFDGRELWKIDNLKYPITESGDHAIQVFDINGDGKNEIVTAVDFKIQIRDGKNGKLLKSVPTPDQNPYYDSKNYKYPKLLGDAICPVKISKEAPCGFYIKDRYTNIWMFDNNMNLLWHKAISTAHFPLPVDINNDGIEEILVNHTLLNADGTVIWELPLSDHTDNIAYVSLNPGKETEHFYLAGGEMGLLKVRPNDGEIVKHLQLGHIQTITIADFIPEKEGLELLTQTLWREDRIHYLFDKDLTMISTWDGTFGRIYPIPWGTDGQELVLTPDGIVDPITGQVLYPSFGRILHVLTDERWGNVLIATEEENHLRIYSPSSLTIKPEKFLYSRIQSHYLPVIKTSSHK